LNDYGSIEWSTDINSGLYCLQAYSTGEADAPAILVVEDNIPVCEMLCWTLQLAGYQVMSCSHRNLFSCVDYALDTGIRPLPALLILDLSQPRTDSSTRLRHLRKRWELTSLAPPAILILTTLKNVYDELSPTEWVIQKPFHIQNLLQTIQKALPI
jgi:DNA-binding response OmpR family regulator